MTTLNLATAGSVGPSSQHSHSHSFRVSQHLTTFTQLSSHQSESTTPTRSTALKRERDAVTRKSHDAVAHQGYEDPPNTHHSVPATPARTTQPSMQINYLDPALLQGSQDAGLLDNQHPQVDDSSAQFHHWDPERLKGSRSAGLPGSRRPRIDDSTQSCHRDPEMLKGSWDAGLPGSRRPQIDEPTPSHHWDPKVPQGP